MLENQTRVKLVYQKTVKTRQLFGGPVDYKALKVLIKTNIKKGKSEEDEEEDYPPLV
mgnify:CR=1 FL=1